MGWLIFIVSLLALCVASIFKVIYKTASSYRATSTFLSNGGGYVKKNVLLVIAHPDDESMFFTPTINYLISRGHNLHILCMSTGNADGMGDIRKEELYRASLMLEVPNEQVTIIDHPNLQDGFGITWDSDLLARIIDKEIHAHDINLIITFDGYGVSGHCNHRDVHRGVRKLLEKKLQRDIEAWELASTNILRKYSGPFDIWISILYASRLNGTVHCLVNERRSRTYDAMAQHRSQWVWFRKLFVSLSSYTQVNTLKKIDRKV